MVNVSKNLKEHCLHWYTSAFKKHPKNQYLSKIADCACIAQNHAGVVPFAYAINCCFIAIALSVSFTKLYINLVA